VTALAYAWERLPLIALFAGSYVVYRLSAATLATDAIVWWGLRKARGRATRVFFYLIAGTAALSFFLPNAVAVLAVLPVLKVLQADFADQGADPRQAATVLTLSIIYGANIGGLGSLLGSPANLLLVAALDFLTVPGREQLTFASWFAWSLPLVAVFVLAGWLVAGWLAAPRALRAICLPAPPRSCSRATRRQMAALKLGGAYLGVSVLLSLAAELGLLPGAAQQILALAALGGLVWLACVRTDGGEPALLPWRAFGQGLPLRGLAMIGLVTALALAVEASPAGELLAAAAGRLDLAGLPPVLLYLVLCLAAIFLSEPLSNTLVATLLFGLAFAAATAEGLAPLPLLVAISAASNCAFMTPIATPSSALAFGEMRGTRLRVMLGCGLVLNLFGALILSLWLPLALPLLYGR
jgi:sodium-dependent dicarboxylate transporter 2/3/5